MRVDTFEFQRRRKKNQEVGLKKKDILRSRRVLHKEEK